jgi:putative alpha-1,2-mannosidase
VHALQVDGQPSARPWLPAAFVTHGGTLRFSLQATPDKVWGSDLRDAPPSFPPGAGHAGP